MDKFTFKAFCTWTMTALVQLFIFLSSIIYGAKVFLENLLTIFPEKLPAKPEPNRNPEKITKPKVAPIEDIRKSEVLTRKAPATSIFNAFLRKNYKNDLLRTNRALTETREQLEATKEKVIELEEKIQQKNAELQGAAEKLEESSQRHKDLVLLHKKDKKELTRANRILRRLDRAAQKTGKQKDDPTSTESSKTETVLAVAEVSSDKVVVHHLKVKELESQENETGNELNDLPKPDIMEAEETGGSSEITEERKAESQEFNTSEDFGWHWYRHNGRCAMLDLTKDAEEKEIEPIEPKVKSEPEVKSKPEIEMNQVPKTVETLQTKSSVANKTTKPSTTTTDDLPPQSIKPKKQGFFTRLGFSKSNDTTKKKPKIKLDKMKSLDAQAKDALKEKVKRAASKLYENTRNLKKKMFSK